MTTNASNAHPDTAAGALAQCRECNDPRRDRTAIPYTDDDTYTLIDDAAYTLTIFRAPMSFGDAGAAVSVFVSLAAERLSRPAWKFEVAVPRLRPAKW